MKDPFSRDFKDLRHSDLLADYWSIAERRDDALVKTALRTRSVGMRDILAYGALDTDLSSSALKDLVVSDQLDSRLVRNFHALGNLGRLVLLQNLLEDDLVYGEKLLTIAHDLASPEKLSLETRRVLIEHHVLNGPKETADRLLSQSPEIAQEFHGYLGTELLNPFYFPDSGDSIAWLESFNRPFAESGLASIDVDIASDRPFDSLEAQGVPQYVHDFTDEPLVSVVLTTYQPEPQALMLSVQSILNQTWQNLELIIVDDCSGTDYVEVLENIERIDDRIKVIYASVNRGTYIARNIGYSASVGEYITGQDDDDWSHPERLARQVEFMRQHEDHVACRVLAVRCDEKLGRCRVGYKPVVFNPSSLMLRRSAYEQTGGYLESRKGADSEYYFRLKSIGRGRVGNLKLPLSIIRIRPESLSRGDFSAGWRHPARTSFRSSYRYWHRTTPQHKLRVIADQKPPVSIPQRFNVDGDHHEEEGYDVVFAGDWQRYGGPQKSMLEEIYALLDANLRVAILNLEAARFMSDGASEPLNEQIQELINSGRVGEIFFDDQHEVSLLILRYPPILQFFTFGESSLNVASMLIIANQAPSELDGKDIRYIVSDCHENAVKAFGVTPSWAPQGPQVRDFLENYIESPILTSFDVPGILNLSEWWQERIWYRSTNPVVGRHSRDDPMKWPASREDLERIYRTDGQHDVRIMGGHRSPLNVLKSKAVPAAWTVYKKDAMPVPQFLHALDFFVFYQHPQAVEAFGRSILEALASGTVVILPKHFERVFGAAALYADTDELEDLIEHYHSDFDIYHGQLELSKEILEKEFSYTSYQRLVEKLLHQSSNKE